VTIRLYDSKAQGLREFTSLRPNEVGLYVCGPTVQSSPHIGHLRSALVYDLWRRWFEYRGYRVTLVRNVTDIDDKVLENAAATQGTDAPEAWWALAYRYELEFNAAYRALGIRPPTYEPRATASVPEMIALIERLLASGHAYRSEVSADVYFATASFPAYGELTRQSPSDMVESDADPRGKRDSRDFALWKAHKPGEPESAAWDTPWGRGRPGWHIECSAMSTKYLGSHFDIHGGGLDLRFPHHENELAQSRAAGDQFAEYWIHNGLVNVGGQKMSKSLGNSLYAADLLSSARPAAVRYFLGSAHYRSVLEFHDQALAEADAALDRVEGFLARAERALGDRAASAGTAVAPDFAEAMDDDLGVPLALAALHDTVRSGNTALESGDIDAVRTAFGQVRAMVRVLGLDPADPQWSTAGDTETQALSALVEEIISARQQARANKDFATADRLRDVLAAAGIVVEDGADGTHWSVAR